LVWVVSLSTAKLISRSPTAVIQMLAFGVWLGWVIQGPPRPSSALPPAPTDNASPKAISGRTSYLLVRLAFHPYPQVIRNFCNSNRFEPPTAVMPPSLCSWVAHQVSCLINAIGRPVQTRFRFGSGCDCLSLTTPINSLAHSPKGTPSGMRPKSPSPPTVCQRTVSGSVSLPSPGFFSPFPHGTCPLSVLKSI
jgi:hypothetical protein